MKTTNYPGIDYAAGQPVNRNLETGLRYGIIPSHLGEMGGIQPRKQIT